MITQVVSEFLLFIHFAMIFAVTFIGSVLYFRSRDSHIRRFLGTLYPMAFYLLILFLVTYLQSNRLIRGIREETLSLLALLGVFIVSALIALMVRGICLYSLSLMKMGEGLQKKVHIGINVLCILLFLAWCFTVFYLTGGDWTAALRPSLHLFYLIGSSLVFCQAVWALILIRRNPEERARKLQLRLIFPFLSLGAFIPLDVIFFLYNPFKLTNLSYTVFSVAGYLLISRYNFTDYSKDLRVAESIRNDFYRYHGISGRERELIDLLLEGKTNGEIGELLCISINTVKTHIQNIYQKTGVSSRIQLMHSIKSGR